MGRGMGVSGDKRGTVWVVRDVVRAGGDGRGVEGEEPKRQPSDDCSARSSLSTITLPSHPLSRRPSHPPGGADDDLCAAASCADEGPWRWAGRKAGGGSGGGLPVREGCASHHDSFLVVEPNWGAREDRIGDSQPGRFAYGSQSPSPNGTRYYYTISSSQSRGARAASNHIPHPTSYSTPCQPAVPRLDNSSALLSVFHPRGTHAPRATKLLRPLGREILRGTHLTSSVASDSVPCSKLFPRRDVVQQQLSTEVKPHTAI
ncbi:hypothetical protein HETIRDRAFT_453369 [Heterobasidion irregulare TC 32-1]|uniref:Uncharacterized protein n=1 Tax=Heterobasidion irregulare (strain TC 32-1) TaxID=747525 RepID=W4JZ33_HETIT|nr:uncharacterized protein HETIRDRAFT_453369 [Heterobasidion irregulare TC 32-1]ETW78792.1 hypothetical protein HETIRDRAFT_453369 [Heterobasidion irregulare TC 32-1]